MISRRFINGTSNKSLYLCASIYRYMLIEKETDRKFSKEERLCSKKSIDKLFAEGSSFIAYPLRVVYICEKREASEDLLPEIMISVSKKKFKRAVKRNRVKRLIREGYRLNKYLLANILNEKQLNIDIAFLYLKDELPMYEDIEKAMLKTINILSEKLKDEV